MAGCSAAAAPSSPIPGASSSPASSTSPAFRWTQTARTWPLPLGMARPRHRKSRNGERCPARRRQPLRRPLCPALRRAQAAARPRRDRVGQHRARPRGARRGWWEAEVIGINGTVHSLRWRDYPTQPTILRRADELALLPPAKPSRSAPHPSHTGWLGCPAAGRPAPPLTLLPTFEAPMLTTVLDVDRTRALNDILRRSLSGGLLMLTAGVIALGPRAPTDHSRRHRRLRRLHARQRSPRRTRLRCARGRGRAGVLQDRLLRPRAEGHSPDPADSSITTRMLTIMLAGEY